jgi:hypothetical protein
MEVIMKKTRSFLLTAGFALAMVFTLSCSSDDGKSLGSLDGTWQKSPFTLVIDGNEAILKEDNENVEKCFIDYDDSKGSMTWAYEWEHGTWVAEEGEPEEVTFNYTLNGKTLTLTFSDFELEELNGKWTKE